jgi:hypothetical protein
MGAMARLHILCSLSLFACLAACQATPGTAARSVSGNDRGPDRAGPVAVVAGRPVSKAALADYWFERYPEEYGRTLDALVDERLVAAYARRDGIRVPIEALNQAEAREIDARRKQLASMFGKEADLAAEVRRAYGIDVPTWRRRILRPRLHAKLLMERVIRWDTRSRPRVHARVIVLDDPGRAAKVMAKLRQGADFSLTALKESKDPTARVGGDLPSIGRGDLAFPGVEARLFAAPAGALVGPLEVRVNGRPQWQIYKIIERQPAWQGDVASRHARLENDLVAKPMTGAEYERWRTRVRRDAGVRYYQPDGRVWAGPPR